MLTDEQGREERRLVEQAKSGDEEAFAGLVRMHQARLRMMVARHLVATEDVHDIVQEALFDAYRNLAAFESGRELWPWLWTICRNRMISFLRDRKRRRAQPLHLVDEAIATSADGIATGPAPDELLAMRACLRELQGSHHALMDLRYGQGIRVKDLAQRFGKEETAMSMTLLRIREALLKCLRHRLLAAGS